MEKEIILKIKLDSEKDEFGNLISMKGFEKGQELQDHLLLIGLIEVVKQQEIQNIFKGEFKK